MAENSNNYAALTLDDIIFRQKNKAYGAYDLRHIYDTMIKRSALVGTSIFVGAMLLAFFWSEIMPKEDKKKVVLADVMKLPPPPLDKTVPPPPPPPPPPPEMPKVNSTKFLPPEIVPDEKIIDEQPLAKQEEMKEAPPAAETQVGDPNAVQEVVVEDHGSKEVVEVKPAEDEVFTVVEQQAEFPGGQGEMMKFLSKNIKYPSSAQRANVSGRVFLQFVVNANGSIQDVEVIKGVGFGCDEEAARVIKSMPRWSPGKQSGRPVRSKFTLPVSFTLE